MTVQKLAIPNLSCGLCGKTGNLQRCPRCKVMFYCNGEHQAAHVDSHMQSCSMISKKCSRLESEERSLRAVARFPTSFFPEDADIFKDYAGHFWGILETREYMRARFDLVEALKTVNTRYSLQKQVEHLLDMLRLCRSDNMGLRNIVPSLLLRLNRDQECYDFARWWRTTGKDGHYKWDNMDMLYLDTRCANIFEDVSVFCGDWLDLSHTVAVTLLKVKVLLDLRALQNSVLVGEKVPREILNGIQKHVVRSPVIASNHKLMERPDHSADIEALEFQIDGLYEAVEMSNKYFWRRLVEPGHHLTTRPETFSKGSVEEMQLVLQWSYDAWVETPGAIGIIRDLLADDGVGVNDIDFSADKETEESKDYGVAIAC